MAKLLTSAKGWRWKRQEKYGEIKGNLRYDLLFVYVFHSSCFFEFSLCQDVTTVTILCLSLFCFKVL